MVTTAKRLTTADLVLFELNADDFEILDGELKERKTVGGLHGRVGFGMGGADDLVGGAVLPGFRVWLRKIFP